ncbi:Mobile element protein [Microcystis aeruginosa NIES-2549]|uniref:Mobile element protein n=1 Tax=Microcystis aeruginosa NIES-2549 TaxID=1641812 RepID=A0A0F6RLK3_MICAE|nr:Mobile element protein [Microcystis aeruginosa NIES-2549]AOC53150.1 Mobile element protein [Microcystis aeruginosa NIES-2481]
MGASDFCKSTELGFLRGNYLLKLVITSDLITQSKLLGGSTPQTPRWGRKRGH